MQCSAGNAYTIINGSFPFAQVNHLMQWNNEIAIYAYQIDSLSTY